MSAASPLFRGTLLFVGSSRPHQSASVFIHHCPKFREAQFSSQRRRRLPRRAPAQYRTGAPLPGRFVDRRAARRLSSVDPTNKARIKGSSTLQKDIPTMRGIFPARALALISICGIGSSVQTAAFSFPTSTWRSSTTAISMSSSTGSMHGPIAPISLSGKTALVTGASGGIGKGIATVFAEAGADVIVHYNTRHEGAKCTFKQINDRFEASGESNEANGISPGKCLGIIQADFRNPKAVDEMFRFVTNDILKNSRLDILVNNAGIVTKLALEDDDADLSSWHETMAVNLHAPLQLMKLAHGHMKSTSTKRKGGVIINNTSIHGSRSVEYMTAYAASKAALDSLTRGLACEYAPDGIRVNAVAPGVVPVERTEEAFSDRKVVRMWSPHLPVGRLGTVEDVSRATLLLATNEWMSGTVLNVDGGMMARANMPIRPRPPKPQPNTANNSNGQQDIPELEPANVSFEVPLSAN